jgi:hypothetical protein
VTLEQLVQLVPQLGTTGVLAGVAYTMWRERNVLQALVLAEKQARIDDAGKNTTAMLAIAERVHSALEKLDERDDR